MFREWQVHRWGRGEAALSPENCLAVSRPTSTQAAARIQSEKNELIVDNR